MSLELKRIYGRTLIPRHRRLSSEKVLIIVNSSSSLSNDVADYYIEKRGLNAQKLSLSFGSNITIGDTVTPNHFTDFIVPTKDAINSFGATSVLMSVDTPLQYRARPNSGNGAIQYPSAAAIFGAAKYIFSLGNIYESGDNISLSPTALSSSVNNLESLTGDTSILSDGGYQGYIARYDNPGSILFTGDFVDYIKLLSGSFSVLPCGRIGLPKDTYGQETWEETKRIIDDAVWAEQYQTDRSFVVSVHNNAAPLLDTTHYATFKLAQAAGLDPSYFVNSYGDTSEEWYGKPPSYDYTKVMVGTEVINFWGYMGGAILNAAIDAPYKDSFYPVRGAWCNESTSFGYRLGYNLIKRGACACIGSYTEPFSNGITVTYRLLHYLMQGCTMAEASILGTGVGTGSPKIPWAQFAFGDPLYKPFGTDVSIFSVNTSNDHSNPPI